MSSEPANTPAERPPHFIEQIVEADNAAHKWGDWPGTATPRVHTRFPPEPNGYLHIGHAKSICLNYGLAVKFGGKFNLRFDDTNPSKEEQEYVDAIKKDVAWITSAFGGSFDRGPHAGGVFWASDYFQTMYDFAVALIRAGKAYVCDLSGDEVSKRRGTPSVPATSPFRDRPIEESVRLFAEMKEGKHPDGSRTLRAKIDLASPNFNLRDPVMYRILHESHHNTGTTWCIYPMYDWAHGIEDSLENITHSICTLEFENHRPLYDWFMRNVAEAAGGTAPDGTDLRAVSRPSNSHAPEVRASKASHGPEVRAAKVWHSQQIEFAKLQFTYTLLSKRNLLRMVNEKFVTGWDDPRMPTLAGFRRRGYTPQSIRALCEEVGVTKVESVIDLGRLENACRDHLNKTAPRAMSVLRPLKVVIDNWPAGKVDHLDFVINPEDASAGKRTVPFSGTLFIERDDFMEVPAKKFFRLAPGVEVRLRWAYFIKCVGVDKDAHGNITAVHCTYDPATRGGDAPDGRKVKGTLHWVSADHAVGGTVRLFDRLFKAEEPAKATGKWEDDLNPHSLEVIADAKLDPCLAHAKIGERYQFERLGYFCVDRDSTPGKPVFNRTVTLKDAWAKEAKKE